MSKKLTNEQRLRQNETQKRYRERKLNSPDAELYRKKERDKVYGRKYKIPFDPTNPFWINQTEIHKQVFNKY